MSHMHQTEPGIPHSCRFGIAFVENAALLNSITVAKVMMIFWTV